MTRHDNGTVTINKDEFVELMARHTANNKALHELGEVGCFMMLLIGEVVAESTAEMFNGLDEEQIRERKEAENKVREDIIKKVDEFLKGFFNGKPIQTFNTRNTAGDEMVTIYSDDDVIIDHCPNWDYIEIFGLSDKEFDYLMHNCDSVCC